MNIKIIIAMIDVEIAISSKYYGSKNTYVKSPE